MEIGKTRTAFYDARQQVSIIKSITIRINKNVITKSTSYNSIIHTKLYKNRSQATHSARVKIMQENTYAANLFNANGELLVKV